MISAKECLKVSKSYQAVIESKGLDFFKEKAEADALEFFNSKHTEDMLLSCASVGETECYFAYESFLKHQYPNEAIDHMNLFLNSKFQELGYILITSFCGLYIRWSNE